jgi:Xaa-Pro dipeptidase
VTETRFVDFIGDDGMNMDRITRVQAAMTEAKLDVLALIPGSNFRYLTGFSPMLTERLALVLLSTLSDTPTLVIPALEAPGARTHLGARVEILTWDDATGSHAALQDSLNRLGGEKTVRAGVEFTAMRIQELRALENAATGMGMNLKTVDATTLLGRLRMVKDTHELAAMERAAQIVERALGRTIEQIRPGLTERELSRICTREIHEAGADGESFEAFVGAGPNSANPHHEPGDRSLQSGDLIIIDCGAVCRGYASDITRTVALGEPGDQAHRIYETVKAANAAGRLAVRPGVTGEEVDRAARQVIEEAGYGAHFLHRTGHGLGLQTFPCHEYPDIVAGSRDPLPVGTTFTIEPGVYLEGFGGVRIEDDVVVTATGHRSLTDFDRELVVVPV